MPIARPDVVVAQHPVRFLQQLVDLAELSRQLAPNLGRKALDGVVAPGRLVSALYFERRGIAPHAEQVKRVVDLAIDTADYVGKPGCVSAEDIVVDCNYIGPGYGQPTEAMNEAVVMLARTEGLLFDPVYTGKALAGMIDYVREGRFDAAQKIVFLHTGGAVGLFAYGDILDFE